MKLNTLNLKVLFVLTVAVLLNSCKPNETDTKVIETGTVTDIDGNNYKTVKIGNQWWMAENLAVTHFSDSTDIALIDITSMDSTWANSLNPAYSSINDGQYGFLYNYAVVESEKNIAPEGWHVATDEDWKMLEREIGMSAIESNALGWRGETEANKLTARYSYGWPDGSPLFGTDEFGFNAKPGGCRIFNGETNIQGNTAFWWTSNSEGNEAWYRYIDANQTRIFRQHTYKGYGMSIRCVKNN